MSDKGPQTYESIGSVGFSQERWRQGFLKVILRAACVIGLAGAVVAAIDSSSHGHVILAEVYAAAWVLLAIITVFRWPYWLRAGTFLFILFALGMSGLLETGMRGDAPLLLLVFSVMTALLVSPRAGVAGLGFCLLTIAAFAPFAITGRIYLTSKVVTAGDADLWLTGGIELLFLGAAVLIGLTLLLREFSSAQTRLIQSEVKFSRVFHANPLAMGMATLSDGRVLEVNDAFEKRSGYSRAEVIGGKIPELGFFDDSGKFDELRQLLLTDGSIRNLEVPVRIRDGRLLTCLIAVEPIDLVGEPCFILAITDITDRKNAEQNLRESNEQFSKLFRASPDAILLTELESGRIVEVNESFEKWSGYSRAELIGHQVDDLGMYPPAARQRFLSMLREHGSIRNAEFDLKNKAGEVLLVLASATMIEIKKKMHAITILADITERRRLEEQLRQAQKMEAVGQLAGGVAHDFNNILAATMMNLDLLKEDPSLNEKTQEALEELKTEAERAATLTRRLLMFSRRSVLDIRTLNVSEVVDNLLKMLGRLLGENITLVFERNNSLPVVEADAGMMEQVLVNLAINARDAMPKGGRITLSTSAVEMDVEHAAANRHQRAGRFVCLSVSDTGCGMDEATLKRMFEPFFTTKAAGKGTGLGLATVYGIVAQHSGWVEVESHVGKGTTLRIYLPASAKVVTERQERSPQVVLKGQETLLVVEDDPSVRRMLVKALRALGYQVFEASNGQEAMTLWREHGQEIDLLLTDMVMPEGMTGYELADRVREILSILVAGKMSASNRPSLFWGCSSTTPPQIVCSPATELDFPPLPVK